MSETEVKAVVCVGLVLLAAAGTFAFLWRVAVADANRWQSWSHAANKSENKLEQEVAILKAQIAKVQRIFEGEGDS